MSEPVTNPNPPREKFHNSVFGKLRGYFLAGLLVTAPISITLYLTWAFLVFVDSRVSSIITSEYYRETAVPGLGLLIAILFFIAMGWAAKNYLGRVIIRASEYLLDKMPVIRTIYGGSKQILEAIIGGSQKQAFREVVLFEYPRPGIWTIGVITGPPGGEVQNLTGDDVVSVFLPTTPSPTNGLLLFIPYSQLHVLKMTVDEAFKMILSGGILTPPDRSKNGKPRIEVQVDLHVKEIE